MPSRCPHRQPLALHARHSLIANGVVAADVCSITREWTPALSPLVTFNSGHALDRACTITVSGVTEARHEATPGVAGQRRQENHDGAQ